MIALTTADALLADIIESPADDTLRLIFADWCEDQGDVVRAEFIRAQIVLDRPTFFRANGEVVPTRDIRNVPWIEEAKEAESRWLTWHARPTFLPSKAWRRGFIARVGMTLQEWLDRGPALVREWPLEEVRISDREPAVTAGPYAETRWYAGSAKSEEKWRIDGRIFDVLSPPCATFLYVGESPTYKAYHPTPGTTAMAAALGDLSRACLTWAKKE